MGRGGVQEREERKRKGRGRKEGKGETCHTNPSLLLAPLLLTYLLAGGACCYSWHGVDGTRS